MNAINRKLATVYLLSAVLIFTFAAIAKVSTHYTADELKLNDPFLRFLSVGQLLYLSTAFEGIVVALIVMKSKRYPFFAVGLTLWSALLFLAYRLGFLLSPEGTSGAICKCFGGPGGILGKNSDGVAWLLLAYLIVVGGFVTVVFALGEDDSIKQLGKPKPSA